MRIFIVSKGEKHEGSSIKGVFDSIEKARARCVELRDNYSWNGTRWQELSPDYWEDVNGCDYIVIKPHEVL